MAKHLLLAMTNPVEGADAGFNDWYDTVAVPTYRTLPGLVPLGRFKAVDAPHLFPFEMDNQFQYLSLYYFEADDVGEYLERIKAAFASRPDYQFSPLIDQTRFFEPIYVAISDLNFEPIDRFERFKIGSE